MKFNKVTLPNGLRILTVPMPDNGTVTAMVLVEAGSRYETKEKNGISHFLEHMCFKGTVNRPNVLAISTEFESLGAQYNAFTSGTYTGYYAKVSKDKGAKVLEMISDMFLNATLPEEEIKREKGVIIEEINMIYDRPDRVLWHVFDEMLYPHHPAGFPIIGNKETVQSLTRDDLMKYRTTHYVPRKTLVVVAGNIHEETVMHDVSNMFGSIPDAARIEMIEVNESQKEPQIAIYDKQTDQTHFILGFRIFNRFDPRRRALSVLSTILGHGMSSRLFHRIREELGLCYSIRTSTSLEHDCGVFMVNAGVAHEKIEETIREVLKVIKDVCINGVTDQELQKAKDYRIGNMYLGLETSDALADWYAFQEIDKEEILTPEALEAEIRAVTKEEVQSVAKDVYDLTQANLAVVGPHKGKEDAWRKLLC